MILQSLTSSEEEIMQLIWTKEKIFFRELMDIIPEPKPHQNTVSTFLKILVEKGYLTTEKHGRIFLYSSTISLTSYKKKLLNRFLENYFDNSASELIKVLKEENHLSSKEIEELSNPKNMAITKRENTEENNIKVLIKEIIGERKNNKKKKKKKKK